jgi:hypothetical protein
MRVPPIAPQDLSEEQLPLFQSMTTGVAAKQSNLVTT